MPHFEIASTAGGRATQRTKPAKPAKTREQKANVWRREIVRLVAQQAAGTATETTRRALENARAQLKALAA